MHAQCENHFKSNDISVSHFVNFSSIKFETCSCFVAVDFEASKRVSFSVRDAKIVFTLANNGWFEGGDAYCLPFEPFMLHFEIGMSFCFMVF